MDVGYPVHETKEFASDQEALEYGKHLFGEFDCADEL